LPNNQYRLGLELLNVLSQKTRSKNTALFDVSQEILGMLPHYISDKVYETVDRNKEEHSAQEYYMFTAEGD